MTAEREFDLIVYGASSFVGRLTTRYLVERHGPTGALKWALAGRNRAKLETTAAEFGAQQLPIVIADAADPAALTAMAMRTRVVVSTVGPYALHGSHLVAACADKGTDYCDLTGEPQWMRQMIEAHEARAIETGARIVHSCGFDSIPSDLGVWFTQQQARDELGEYCTRIKGRVKAMRGGASGGTVASMINVMNEMKRNPQVRKVMKNPYALCPEGARKGVRQASVGRPVYDKDARSWLAPFIMAGINTKVVHRSHALQGHPWGAEFRYDEATMTGDKVMGGLRASGLTAGMSTFLALIVPGPTRGLLEKFVLPKPGEGPTPEQQEKGFFDLRFFGRTASGRTLVTRVTGDRDPGYGSTAKMLGEAAVCLAKDRDQTPTAGGFPTPSVAMDGVLVKRLIEHAGLKFERL